jgi:tRNA-dihydrouridine synthase
MCRIEQGLEPKQDSLEQQIEDLKKHIEYIYSIKDERQASGIMRSVSVHYMKGFENVKKYRLALVHCESKQDYLDVLSNMQNEQ